MKQSPAEAVAAAYQRARHNLQSSSADASQQFLEEVSRLMEEAAPKDGKADSTRFAGLLIAARDYEVDDTFGHPGITCLH